MTRILKLLSAVGGRRRLILMALLAAITAVLEAIAATLVFVLMQLILNPDSPIVLPVVGDVRSLLSGLENGTLMLTIGIAIFFLLHAAIRVGETYLQQRFSHGIAARLSVRLIDGYLSLPYAFHLDRASAELIRNAHDAAQRLGGHVVLPVIRLFAETVMVIAVFVVLVLAAPLATVLVIGVLGPVVLLLVLVIHPRLKRQGRRAHRLAADSISILQQSLEGIREVVLYGKPAYFVAAYARARKRLARSHYLQGTMADIPRTVLQTALLLFILGFFALSLLAERSSAETLAILALFAYAGLRLQPSLQKIVGSINSLKYYGPAVDDISADIARFSDGSKAPADRNRDRLVFEREIRVDGVSHYYAGSNVPAVENVSFRVERGSSVGLCGPTGGGKTTLADLITGLLEPSEGSVTVDDVDIRSSVTAWQEQLGVVSQSMFLLDDTLRGNIAFGVAEGEIDDDAVWEAVRLAQLEEFVAALPAGLDSRVGERGVKISGGQRQRVAIARAFYRRPEVLVFDEGTSALDNVTEGHLMEALKNKRRTKTLILIAHRLSTVRSCDTILYIDGGQIRAQGTYDELLKSSGAFRALASSG